MVQRTQVCNKKTKVPAEAYKEITFLIIVFSGAENSKLVEKNTPDAFLFIVDHQNLQRKLNSRRLKVIKNVLEMEIICLIAWRISLFSRGHECDKCPASSIVGVSYGFSCKLVLEEVTGKQAWGRVLLLESKQLHLLHHHPHHHLCRRWDWTRLRSGSA